MKIFYFLATSILTLSLTNAQSLTSVSSNPNMVMASKNPTILYQQNQTSENGIVSSVLTDGKFIISTDDFMLAKDADATRLFFLGFQNRQNITTLDKGLVVYIYGDNNGKPDGTPSITNNHIAKIELESNSPAYTITSPSVGYYLYKVDLVKALGKPLSLEANKRYWVAFAPKLNISEYSSLDRWNWINGTKNANSAKLLDLSDAFGAGATNWTDIKDLMEDASFEGLAFTIEEGDELVMGTNEAYNSIKDLVVTQDADQLYVFAKNHKLKAVEIFSIDGKKVLFGNNDKINISKLTSGNYLVKVTTLGGKTISTKFIKK